MRKNLIITLGTIVFLGVCINSCKKENAATAKDNLLGKWMPVSTKSHTSVTISGINSTFDTTYYPTDCQKDDYVQLNSDNTYVYSNGGTPCSLGETNETGTWSLSTDNKSLTLKTDTAIIFDITELTSSKLVIHNKSSISGNEGQYIYSGTIDLTSEFKKE